MTSSAVTAPGQQAAGHAVSGGGIEAVAGEEGAGRALRRTTLPSKNRAQRWAQRAQNSTSWLTMHHRDAAR